MSKIDDVLDDLQDKFTFSWDYATLENDRLEAKQQIKDEIMKVVDECHTLITAYDNKNKKIEPLRIIDEDTFKQKLEKLFE